MADSVMGCVKRNKRKERERPGGGGGGIGGGWGGNGGGGSGKMLHCEVVPGSEGEDGEGKSCVSVSFRDEPGGRVCVDILDRNGEFLYHVCITDEDGDGVYVVRHCWPKEQPRGGTMTEIQFRMV